MLELAGLTIRAGGRVLVGDLSLTLPAQGIIALIGPSGCGKSTVLKWLAGILPPGLQATGLLRIDGRPAAAPHPAIAWQPQGDALFPWLTIARNAALGLRLEGMPRRAAQARVAALFAPFGLSGTEQALPEQLSGGMRQRAAFLRTMVQDRPYVLLDEPFSALDAVTRLRMQGWLAERLAAQPRGVLLVTHDLHEATALADRVLVMGGGRIRAAFPVALPHGCRTEAALAPLRETLTSLLLEEDP